MSIRTIVTISPEQISDRTHPLFHGCVAVNDFGNFTEELVQDLIDTLFAHKIAVGLAAPQIGVAVRVAVVNTAKESQGRTLVFCNPRVISESGKKDKKLESCMSLPGVGGVVQRREKLRVEFQTVEGIRQTLEFSGFNARVVAHEIDHLNGKLYVDRMQLGESVRPVDIFARD